MLLHDPRGAEKNDNENKGMNVAETALKGSCYNLGAYKQSQNLAGDQLMHYKDLLKKMQMTWEVQKGNSKNN